jgi:hypothetical protein
MAIRRAASTSELGTDKFPMPALNAHQIAVEYIIDNLQKIYHLAGQSNILPKGVEIRTLPEPYRIFYQINSLLCKMHPGICATIGIHTIRCDLTRRHLILTTRERLQASDYPVAMGMLTRLHEDLVDRVPAGWVVIRCKPPQSSTPEYIEMGDAHVDLTDLQYKIYPVPGRLTWDICLVISIGGIRKHIRNEASPGRLIQGFLTYLKHLAGEHPVLSCVNSVRVSPVSSVDDGPQTQGDLQPMSQLASDLRTVIREYRHCVSCLLHDGNVDLADEDLRLRACSSTERDSEYHICVDCATCLSQWMCEWDSPDPELDNYQRLGPRMQVPDWVKRIGTPPTGDIRVGDTVPSTQSYLKALSNGSSVHIRRSTSCQMAP